MRSLAAKLMLIFPPSLFLLSRYHHRNILSLVACSNDGPRPCLVYEYMENGSLADCLLGKVGLLLLGDHAHAVNCHTLCFSCLQKL